jgi:hypothetical protein
MVCSISNKPWQHCPRRGGDATHSPFGYSVQNFSTCTLSGAPEVYGVQVYPLEAYRGDVDSSDAG